jgi:4-amino-4-deoxy-L-arabinose transferase-like glycosyltransferase
MSGGRWDARARAHYAALLLLVATAVGLRLALAQAAPPFLNADSPSYYLPARALIDGEGLDLRLQRTPMYPLFIATVVALVGENLQALVVVQHFLFGPITAILTYLLGCLLANRVVGLIAGLLTACSGPLLLYEHYVMTEAPTTVLLLATLLTTILASQRASWRWATTAGVLFGALVLCRPAAQAALPILLGLVVGVRMSPRRGFAAAAFGLGAAVLLLPWMAYNYHQHGSFAVASNGRFLLARLIKEEPGVYSLQAPPGLTEDPIRARARQIVLEEAAAIPVSSGADRLRGELGLSLGEAHRIQFDLAVEAIGRSPREYVTSSARFFRDVLIGEPIDVRREGLDWERVDWGRAGRSALRSPVAELDAPRAQALLSIYDPARYGPVVPTLFAAGLLMAAMGFTSRPLLVPGLVTLLLLALSATLGGHEVRHRYPQDPLIALVAVQAVATVLGQLRAHLRRSRPELPRERRAYEGRG